MIEPTLALQKALRSALIVSPGVTARVPASAIMDRNLRPEIFPCILIGEGHAMPSDGLERHRQHVVLDLHVWTADVGLASCNQIVGEMREALRALPALEGFYAANFRIAATRFLREQASDAAHSAFAHGVVTVEAELVETTP